MFGISFGELLLIFLIGILVLKPNDIKVILAQIKNWIGFFRKETNTMKNILNEFSDTFDDKTIYDVKDAISLDVSKNNNIETYGNNKK